MLGEGSEQTRAAGPAQRDACAAGGTGEGPIAYAPRMRKPPRPATLVLGLLLLALAIWRLFTCGSAPPEALTALFSAAPSARASASAVPSASPRRRPPGEPLALLSASASPDSAALGAIEGRVVSSRSGKGLAGARVVLEHENVATEVVCDKEGAFRFAPPAAGTYLLVHASADGHLPYAPEGTQSPIALTARPGAKVSGFVLTLDPELLFDITVLSPDDKPVAGAEVSALGPESAPRSKKILTNAEGEARASLPREAIIEARHKDFAPGRTRLGRVAEASRSITIRLNKKGERDFGGADKTIAGKVVDGSGAPVPGARVVATIDVPIHAAAGADLHPTGSDESGADGTFRIEGLDSGAYDLIASDGEHAPARAEKVAAGAEGVTLKLGTAGAIEGVVRNQDGKPVAAFSVVVSIPRGPLQKEEVTARSFVDAEGRFTIEGLEPNSYEVVAVAAGSAPSSPAKTTIADPPGEPAKVELTLARGATLRGTVIDRQTKQPIEGAHIQLEGYLGGGGDGVPLLANATSAADGSFELRGLGSGMRSLAVTAEGHHGRIVSRIAVTTTDPPPITVELTPTKKGEEPGMELVGIGAALSPKDDVLEIGQVFPGGGAAEAGLGPGDAVLAIDGIKVTDLGFEGSIQRIRGPEDSSVVLSVRKAGATEVIDIVVNRRRIKG